jgi:hypothetical protein
VGMARQAPRPRYERKRYVANNAIEAFRARSGGAVAHLDDDTIANVIDEKVEQGIRVGRPLVQPDQRLVALPDLPVKLYAILRSDEKDKGKEAVVTLVTQGAFDEIRARGGSGTFGAKLAAALAPKPEPEIQPIASRRSKAEPVKMAQKAEIQAQAKRAPIAEPVSIEEPAPSPELIVTYYQPNVDRTFGLMRVEKADAASMIRELVSLGEADPATIEVWTRIPIRVRQTVEVDGLL